MKKIAVIGSGIVGVNTAYQLYKKGYNVSVFEKERYPAMETSFANGGQLSASNAEGFPVHRQRSGGPAGSMDGSAIGTPGFPRKT